MASRAAASPTWTERWPAGACSRAALLVLVGFGRVRTEGGPPRGAASGARALAGGRLRREAPAAPPSPYTPGNALIVPGRYAPAEAVVGDVIADAAARGTI